MPRPKQTAKTGARPRPLVLKWLYALSGFSALALETLWMREIALRAGTTVGAAAVVLAVFFLAAGLGCLWGGSLVRRGDRPLIYYGRCEVAAGALAIALFGLGRWLWENHPGFSAGWGGALATAALLAGPSSFLAGVAFPSLAETFVPGPDRRTAIGAPFYGVNLLGAALGVCAGGVLLPWWIGMARAFVLAAGLQVAGGLVAWAIAARAGLVARPAHREVPVVPHGVVWPGWALLVVSGLLSISAQTLLIAWVRQVLQGSVYAVSAVLVSFVAGLGLGALAVARLRTLGRTPWALLLVFSGMAGLLLLAIPPLGAWLVDCDAGLIGASPPIMLAEALGWTIPCLVPLTFFIGGVFPVAWELARSHTAHEGRVLGLAMASNKFGAACGAAAGVFVLLPAVGLSLGTTVVGFGYVALAGAVGLARPSLRTPATLAVLAALVMAFYTGARPHAILGMIPGYRVIATRTSPFGPVTVAEDPSTGSRQIFINSRQRLSGTSNALASQRHQSWVPLLFCQRPAQVLTIGAAAGISAAAALDFPVDELLAVELVPDVVRAAREHFSDWNGSLFSDPRARVISGDGRVLLARMQGGFDVIIGDLFFPAEDGTANLYSRDFFHLVRRRLNPGGLFCLWLPCYQHTAGTVGPIVRTFLDVFPHAIAVRANLDPIQPVIGLLGSGDPVPLSRAFLSKRLAEPSVQRLALQSPFFRSPDNAWLLVVGDLRAATPDFLDFPATTDDWPLLAYLGARRPTAGERLIGTVFLDWSGKRFVRAMYPSGDLGGTAPEQVLASVRAGNLYFAAAVARSVIPGDTRPEQVRIRQTEGYMARAKAIAPATDVPESMLGR